MMLAVAVTFGRILNGQSNFKNQKNVAGHLNWEKSFILGNKQLEKYRHMVLSEPLLVKHCPTSKYY